MTLDSRAAGEDPRGLRVDILGVGVDVLTRESAVQIIQNWIEVKERKYVCVNTVHSLLCARNDPRLRDVYRRAGLVTADGMPLVWLSRRRGRPDAERVYGPDLMLDCCDRFRNRGTRHFFYGGAAGVPELLTRKLTERFPGLNVVGGISPPFRPLTETEKTDTARQIDAAAPDIVWVGLGCPKQDRWMADFFDRLQAPVLIGVGAAFDFHSGSKRQAPGWMQRSGLEWAFRLLAEPRRLANRYLVGNARFLALVAAEELHRCART